MSKYSREMIAQILAANDIVDVIGGSVELKSAGVNRFKGLSPFTNEKTPSFMVSRDRQMYHCFSSGQGGDTISFLMHYEGLSFNEALQKLADRAGIKLEASGMEGDREAYMRRRVLDLNEFAAKFYRRCLLAPMEGAPGRAYLKQRGLQESTETRFGLGLAQEGWSHFYEAAAKQQFRESEIMASGLVRKGDRSVYDFFRNRVIVPIRDVSGNVVAFGGRDLGDSSAKYINSPETAAYKKSRVLYGLYEARDAMRRAGYAILVEGYFDLMRCFDVGVENVVATCGTALTEQHAMLVKRYVPEVVMVYDGDDAGIRAAMKSIGILTAAGLTVRAMAPPDGKDPDDYIRDAGPDAFRQQVSAAGDFVSFYIDMSKGLTGSIEGRTSIAHELFAIIRALDEPIRVDQYLRRIASRLEIDPWDCKRDFERFCRNKRPASAVQLQESAHARSADVLSKDDVDFVAALLAFPEHRAAFLNALEGITSEEAVFTLAKQVCDADARLAMHELDDEKLQAMLTAAVNTETPEPARAHMIVKQRIARFKQDAYRREMQELKAQMRQANQDKDSVRAAELHDRIRELKIRLEELVVV